MKDFKANVTEILSLDYGKTVETADTRELYAAVAGAAMCGVGRDFAEKAKNAEGKKAAYLSAEFLIGRMTYNNLLNLGLLGKYTELMDAHRRDPGELEDVEDPALGNGGLGRLAACFLDSGATLGYNLNGYGIRYRYGLFKQTFKDGFQNEEPDDWTKDGDPWSVRCEKDKVLVHFKDGDVYAVPYDMPVVGYGGKKINMLRLWQAEPVNEFDFDLFNGQKYSKEAEERNKAFAISAVLYPNDSEKAGKQLRLKQQYFFSSASVRDMIRTYKEKYGNDFKQFPSEYAIQLNDTHPTVAIPEFMRIMVEEEGMTSAKALRLAKETFAYTNHTVMAEALEKWDVSLFKSVIPDVFKYVKLLQRSLEKEIASADTGKFDKSLYNIIDGNLIHMARMAIFASHSTNGVAEIHTEILKNDALKEWYKVYPQRFNNKTNGITQRRWLALCNMELSGFISDRIGKDWVTDLDELKKLAPYAKDTKCVKEFNKIKQIKKQQLSDYIFEKEGTRIDPQFIFDIQIKRLHEYKRQLMNAFSILDIYFGLKDGRIKDFTPMCFIFGAKAAPGYFRAKSIIKFINEIAKLIDSDKDVKKLLKVVFVQNYNVSYAEKLVTAADISEQISTAGTEASGTGNMKLMLNGAVTLGTYDGANVEIVREAGEENNYIFGNRVEDIEKLKAKGYNSKKIYKSNKRLKRVVDTLVDGTFDDGGTGGFKELYDSLLEGASWHKPDHYFIFADFDSYVEAKLKANKDYKDRTAFGRKCLLNTAAAGKFSSDRTIRDYAKEVWDLD
ncbi:MAG: glycogen/starch/alpha-glucan phosphorylase [Lachnospiraceae bacterium]|nr:glycogen/starch/alpha-glucan phosphorylase [Lachnospiraceae bacterium]